MATFYNQATLSYGGRVTNSNVTEGQIISGLSLTKTAITTSYGPGDGIVYSITLANADSVAKNGLTLTDNLGAYTLPGGDAALIPLTYVEGSIVYYKNGILQPAPTIEASENLIITGIDVPAGGNVIILYEATANDFAPLSQGSSIFNNVTASGEGVCDELTDNAIVTTREEPLLSIAKAMCPGEITCGDQLTYTFIIQNNGNTDVVATDNLTVSDVFNPPLANITVALNGEELAEGTEYTYNEETGEFTTIGGAIPVPAATFARDPISGIVTTSPGVATLTITGTVNA